MEGCLYSMALPIPPMGTTARWDGPVPISQALLTQKECPQPEEVSSRRNSSQFLSCLCRYLLLLHLLSYLFIYLFWQVVPDALSIFLLFFLPPTVIVLITHAVEICSNNKVGIVVDLMSNPCFLTQNFHFPQFHYC